MRATRVGVGALAALQGSDDGRVLAWFPKACYVSMPAGLIALVAPGVAPGPIHAELDGFPPPAGRGVRARVVERRLEVGGRSIDFADAMAWHGPLPSPDDVRASADRFVYTHDSIGLGEDGPTHQPIEQIASLRGTPNLNTWRPCDMAESAVAWKSAIERKDGPSALIFTRQNLVHQARDNIQLDNVARGGYVLHDCAGHPEAILIATGSEVALAMQAAEQLALNGRHIRVVSMPCTSLFDQQDAGYRETVLPSDVFARVAIEAAHKDFWYKYVGLDGAIIGMESFGESAPGPQLMEYFGFTVDAVVETVNELLDN